MKAKIKSGKGKLIASAIFFCVALIGIAVEVLYFCGVLPIPDGTVGNVFTINGVVCVVSAILSIILNLLYRRRVVSPGAFSTTMLVLSCLIFIIPILILIMAFLMGKKRKTVTVIGKDGMEYILTQTDEGSDEYEDHLGNIWRTKDGGKTFNRIDKIIKDEDGNKHTLTPRFPGSETYYRDENGDDWTTNDGGRTFRRD